MMARKKNEMMSPEEVEKQLQAYAEAEYDKEAGGGGAAIIGIKGFEFRMNGEDLGTEMDVVVVANSYEHAYYDSAYDKDDPQPPACFAIAIDEDDLEPHPDSPNPQCDTTCADCWANEWGSSATGRGKACKNSRRLALLAVGDDGVAFGEMPVMKVPPTSMRNYSGYAKRSTKVTGRPTFSLITHVEFDENNADYEELKFSLLDKINDPAEIQQILEMRDDAEEVVLTPFDASNYKDPEELKKSRRSSGRKATTKKKVAKKKVAKKAASRRSKMS